MEFRDERLGKESIGRLLGELSIPSIIGLMIVALYNVVDTIFVGQGVGSLAMGALSVTWPFQLIIMGIGALIGLGSSSLIARCLGSGERDKAYKTAGNAILLSMVLGIAFSVITFIFMDPLLKLFGASEDILPLAKEYFSIVLFGLPLLSFIIAANDIVRSEGKAAIAMLALVVGGGLNMILDPIFIFVFDMGITGAAIATVIGEVVSVVILVGFLMSGKSSLKLKSSDFQMDDPTIMPEVIALGIPAFIGQVGTGIMVIVVNNILISYGGDMYLAAYGAINKLYVFIMMPIFGLTQGFQPLASYNFGAQKIDRVKEALKSATIVASIISIVNFALFMLLPEQILGLFTSDPVVLEIGVAALRIIALLFPVIGFQQVGATFFLSIGKILPSFILGISRQFLFLIIFVIVLPIIFKVNGVWMAYPVSDFLATALTVVFFVKEIGNLKNMDLKKESVEAK